MYRINVAVYLDAKAMACNKRALERIVEVPDIASVDFSGIITALHFLYGDRAIINFNSTKL